MIAIKVKYENKTFEVESELTGAENRVIFAELVAGAEAALKDLAAKMGITEDMLAEAFTGALIESVNHK